MKKQFFVTIPILPEKNLMKLSYRKEMSDDFYPTRSRFPSIPMIEGAVCPDDEVRIVVIYADDAAGRSKRCLELFEQELADLNEKYGWSLEINEHILLPHQEDRAKQIALFREVSSKYEEGAAVYMDITYGTKITSIGIFSSLVYAEKVKGCTIKGIVYGKYSHDGGETGELYDVRCVYEMNMLIHSLDRGNADALLDAIWE